MSAPLSPKGPSSDVADGEALPFISDHALIRRIGKGAYGAVWLARNVIGGFRAAKVVYRNTFSENRPFEREFEGICKFEPISRTHPGLVTILQVGENLAAGYFYYVMELADDVRTGQKIDADNYMARTLSHEMGLHQRMPLETALPIALSLASALGYLHSRRLIHRDVKPTNIILVNGLAKFADIGLLTEAGEGVSYVGSAGYMPPEGPGESTGDIYSLGKVFYGMFMGKPCKSFPELPGEAEEFTTIPALLQMNNLILKACHHDSKQRFQTAEELHEALVSVSDTVGGKPRSTGAALPPGGVTTVKATHTSEERPDPSGKQQPKPRGPRMAALLVLLLAITGAVFVAMNRPTHDTSVPVIPVIVVIDSTADRAVYNDKDKGKGITNAEELKNVLGQLPVIIRSLAISVRWIEMRWRGEALVIADKPALALIHRSSFFHPIAAEQELEYPPFTNAIAANTWTVTSNRWTIQYQMCDSMLVSFLSNIGAGSPHTKFLVYSRGTDVNWTNENFRVQWIKDIEERFPWLKGRVSPMWIQKGKNDNNGSFRNLETAEDIRNWVKSNLPPPEAAK